MFKKTYVEGPLELLNWQGYIGEEGKGNIVLVTAEVAIMEVKSGKLIRKFD